MLCSIDDISIPVAVFGVLERLAAYPGTARVRANPSAENRNGLLIPTVVFNVIGLHRLLS
jgi:hypothetical protein